jgi:hypothetical protein
VDQSTNTNMDLVIKLKTVIERGIECISFEGFDHVIFERFNEE